MVKISCCPCSFELFAYIPIVDGSKDGFVVFADGLGMELKGKQPVRQSTTIQRPFWVNTY